ncbi:hypothetical protein BD324DRAFT_651696 [Kockovaella imperatae]|uniref:Uncharacterized protein n=1 Tax=Kockovaella imperatae TaxID=4999 RepID=A0A1Y1UEK4_9TREE|nr:hypothetical protein BD324DRAFT_651696 [Kockovaella imperatae]ORX36458.1 hypothetical protein BD324DRAFT_651696 [Kockovaella imperatae]
MAMATTPPSTPKQAVTASLRDLFTPPPTVHRDECGKRKFWKQRFPPLVVPADEPDAPLFSPYETSIRLPDSPSPMSNSLGTELDRHNGKRSRSVTAVDDESDDEIQYLHTVTAAPNRRRKLVKDEPGSSCTKGPLFMPQDEDDHHGPNSMPQAHATKKLASPVRSHTEPDDDYFEILGTPSTPLRQVDDGEARRDPDQSCRACGCTCRARSPVEEEERARPVPRGSGRRRLSRRVMGNLLGEFAAGEPTSACEIIR